MDPAARPRRRSAAPPRPGRRRTRSRGRSHPGRAAPPGPPAGRWTDRGPSTSPTRAPARRSSTRRRRPAVLDFSGWNCVAKTLPRSTAATTGAAVVAGGDDRLGVVRRRRVRVDEVDPRLVFEARRASASRRTTSSTFHCICGRFTPSGSARTAPGSTPRPGDAGVLVASRRTAAACRRRSRGTAGPTRRRRAATVVEPRAFAAPPCSGRTRPTPGQHDRVGVGRSALGSAVSRASAPTCSSAFCAERRLPMP